jgi:dTDP-4-dehydrorhamnose reductase
MLRVEPLAGNRMEVWGGLECTVNRVGGRYYDQLELSGHASRISDLDRIASLGIRTIRYPLLWERAAPSSPREADWRWADERMERLDQLGITPIIGLVHHGSGPRHTSLLDDRFAHKLADYSSAVAERFRNIRYVTPINEPLTTARFSTLYGHWYPHHKSWKDFVAAIVNQCVATRAAMKAMRAHNPSIQLVQTEDLGRIYSTPRLAYQASFENERRWLTFDLLSGRVGERHPMWRHMALDGSVTAQLESLVDDPSPPDIIGINYYVTSDRFLDERVDLYPDHLVGGNGRDRYADVEAVRSVREGISGHSAILSEAWNRYRIPLVVTEAHMGCSREHQLRWLVEAWEGACNAKQSGCDVRAVTAWALFGSFGWDSLVTCEPFSYECGAFDVRSPVPRETALAKVIRDLAMHSDSGHPATDSNGWWRGTQRLTLAPYALSMRNNRGQTSDSACSVRRRLRPILVTGARGTLGSAFVRICEQRGLAVRGMTRSEMNIADPESVRSAIDAVRPWAIINAAGFVRVDDAECDPAACYEANANAVGIIAAEASRLGIPFATYSTDLVFDGTKREPYIETDQVSPLNAYGASKAAAEMRATSLHTDSLVIRTSAFFGPWDEWNFPIIALRNLAAGIPFPAASDSVVSPTYVPDLVNASLDLLIDGESGIWHLANGGALTWSELATEVGSRAALSTELVRPSKTDELNLPARRPAYSVLGSERGSILSSLENALDRWCDAVRAHTLTSSPALQL